MTEEDEDVVMEGSELYNHLKQSGFDEFECALKCQPEQNSTGVSAGKVPSSWLSTISSILTSTWKTALGKRQICEANEVGCERIALLLESGLMFEEDVELVWAMASEGVLSFMQTKENTNSPTSFEKNVISSVAYLSKLFGASWVWALCCGGFVVSHWKSWKRRKETRAIVRLVKVLRILNRNLRKGMQMIQDAEFWAKDKNSMWHMMLVPGLHKSILDSSGRLAQLYKSATLELLACFPLIGSLDAPHHYLANQPLVMDAEKDDDSEVTFSILKSYVSLVRVLQSEFLRRLSLCFCPVAVMTPVSSEAFREIQSVVTKLCCSVEQISSSLNRVIQCCKSWEKDLNINCNTMPVQKGRQFPQNGALYASVQGADIHLRVAGLMIQQIEMKIESGCSSADIKQSVEALLSEVCQCCGCIEQGLVQVGSSDRSQKDSNITQPVTKDFASVSKIRVIDGNVQEENGEDEAWELLMKDVESSGRENEGFDVDLDERESQRAYRERSKLVLSELKGVLTERARMWDEREKKALARKVGTGSARFGSGDIKNESDESGVVSKGKISNKCELNIKRSESLSDEDEDPIELKIKSRQGLKSQIPDDFTMDGRLFEREIELERTQSGNEEDIDSNPLKSQEKSIDNLRDAMFSRGPLLKGWERPTPPTRRLPSRQKTPPRTSLFADSTNNEENQIDRQMHGVGIELASLVAAQSHQLGLLGEVEIVGESDSED